VWSTAPSTAGWQGCATFSERLSAAWPAPHPSPPCAPQPASASSPRRASPTSRLPRASPSPSACAQASCRHPPQHKRLSRCCSCPPSSYRSSCLASTLATSPVSPQPAARFAVTRPLLHFRRATSGRWRQSCDAAPRHAASTWAPPCLKALLLGWPAC